MGQHFQNLFSLPLYHAFIWGKTVGKFKHLKLYNLFSLLYNSFMEKWTGSLKVCYTKSVRTRTKRQFKGTVPKHTSTTKSTTMYLKLQFWYCCYFGHCWIRKMLWIWHQWRLGTVSTLPPAEPSLWLQGAL